MKINKYLKLKITNLIDLRYIPEDLIISTITITCELPIFINTLNIYKYMDMSFGNIITLIYGNQGQFIKSLVPVKRKKVKKNKFKKNFLHQISVVVQISPSKNVNMKLFNNGAIQITGCKNVTQFIKAMEILIKNLEIKKAVVDKTTYEFTLKPFMKTIFNETNKNVKLYHIYSFSIRLINSTVYLDFNVDPNRCDIVLNRLGVDYTNNECSHACITINYHHDNKKVSIFLFRNSIIITGATNRTSLVNAYIFIMKILYENYNELVEIELTKFIKIPHISQKIKEYYITRNAICD